MTVINQTKMTAQKFLMLGEDPPGVRLELVHGEIGVSPSPSYMHSHTDNRLRIILGTHVIKNDLGDLVGDVDTLFGDENVRRPDIIFIAKSRVHLISGHAIPIPPDLCVEILSPASAAVDKLDKFKLYADHGVAHYWIVDPKLRTLKAYRLEDGSYVLDAAGHGDEIVHAAPFSDLALPLGQIWFTKREA